MRLQTVLSTPGRSLRLASFLPSFARRRTAVVVAAGLLGFASCAAFGQATAPGPWSPDAAREERVAALVAQMTLEEKVSQMKNHAAAIPRLNIPPYDYWSEGLHGIARSGYATLFPQAIGMAATWDTSLLHQVAGVISTEARAKYNQAIREGNHDIYYGLTIWSPNINIFRDPRWGRGQETYGEDPFLTSRMGVAFVTGLQGDDPNYLRVVSTPKHFVVHSGPESSRHRFNVDVSPHDLQDTYLPAFRATITEAHAQSIMCAYNAIDGDPACANPYLLQHILRGDWKFNGFVTSDCAAITDVAEGHKFAPDMEHAAVVSVRAGTDTSCGEEYSVLSKAVKDGLIDEKELDVSVKRLFRARFQLGMFDPPSKVAYAALPFTEVDSEAHRKLALTAARESMVLLKNEGDLLPLKTGKTIAVIGPNAASLAAIEGNYNAVPSHPVTPLEALRAAGGKVLYAQGASYAEGVAVPVPETVFRTDAGKPGLHAEYFANTDFTGKPALIRVDSQIDFDWNGGSPAEGVTAGSFGVRWRGTITVPAAGDYEFAPSLAHCYPCGDAEGYAVYLDGKQVAAQHFDAAPFRSSVGNPFKITFADTKAHAFRVEYTHASPRFGAGFTLGWEPPAAPMLADAVRAAEQADVVVAFVGLSPDLEGEEMPIKIPGFDGGDRTDLQLPAKQEQMLEAVAKTGKPMVVVLMNGSALAVNWAKEHAGAILEAWYPGEQGGTAIAETLLGKNNPAGRLPVTFYASISQFPGFDDYSMKGRTYRYSTATPLYAFGYGLSYTHFAVSGVELGSRSVAAGEPLHVKATVANTGKAEGDEVVEVYLTPPASELAPIRELVAFERVHLMPGESKQVQLTLEARQLSFVDALGKRAITPGSYSLFVGGGQPGGDAKPLAFQITGTLALTE
jgi:beta-glucosidase